MDRFRSRDSKAQQLGHHALHRFHILAQLKPSFQRWNWTEIDVFLAFFWKIGREIRWVLADLKKEAKLETGL